MLLVFYSLRSEKNKNKTKNKQKKEKKNNNKKTKSKNTHTQAHTKKGWLLQMNLRTVYHSKHYVKNYDPLW